MVSLTRVDARARAELLTVEHYAISLDLTTGDRHFGSRTTIRFTCRAPGGETFVDVAPHELRSARLNGSAIDLTASFDRAGNRLRLRDLAENNELVVDAVMAYSHDGEGLHRYTDPADGRSYVYAMSFLDAAPRWFACFDQPDLKAPVELAIRCPDDWSVAGNGPATRLADGHWQVVSAAPLATYFTTLVAGPYHSVRDEHDGIPLVLHVRQSLAAELDRDAADLFAHTKRCLDELHGLFAYRYPWGEYHQAFVPEFNAGAMENPGCVTLRDEMIHRSRATEAELSERRVTIAHEMAHMWFGDVVTMRWWDDLWLNESFAEYLGHRASGAHTWELFGIKRKSWGYAADRRATTHPVAGNGAADSAAALTDFDGISYAKGASVLRQLSVHLGDEVFLAGLRSYIEKHAMGNAEFGDLLDAWTAAGAHELRSWADAWLRTSGMDTLTGTDRQLARTSPDAAAARVHAVSVAAYDDRGSELAREQVTLSAETTDLRLPSDAPLILPDASDETWAKIALPVGTWQRMPQTLPALSAPRARVVLWNALQLAAADAEIDPSLGIDIATATLPGEPDDAVIAQVGRWARHTVAGMYLSGLRREEALGRLCDAMLTAVDHADAGSSQQLAAFRLAVATTTDVRRLTPWLAGGHLPDGLSLDADLRWAVVIRLAQLGGLDESDIAAEAAADRTSQGAVYAAEARASLPHAAAKAAAWQALMLDADRQNYELYAIADGFWQPGQEELTDEYVARYFAEITHTADLRSGWVVDRVALRAYPWTAIADSTVAATDRLLADPDLRPGIRRSVSDAGDDLRRALAVRKRFPG